MPGYRLLVPVLPLYALLAGVGVARARTRWAVALLGLACVLPGLDLGTRIPDLRAGDLTRARTLALASWLKTHAHSAALVDIGLIGYASDIDVIDLAGLTDERIARLPGGHLGKRIDPRDLAARYPQAIVVHCADAPQVSDDHQLLACAGFPVERRVLAMPFVRELYRVARIDRIAPNYHYVVLLRDERGNLTAPRDR
jgi:hypothetical protein